MVKIVNSDLVSGKAGKRSGSVKGVVIHNDYGAMNPIAYVEWLKRRKANGQLGMGFAHYYIDKDTIVRVESTFNKAWHTANNDGNANYLGYEVVESYYGVISDAEFIENENMTLRQVAEDLRYYNLSANRNTVRLHNEFSSTSCPHRSWDIHIGKGQAYNTANINKMKDYFIAKIKGYMTKGANVQEMLKNEGLTGGVVVKVPQSTGTYKVAKGDTLWGIAVKYNTSISNIKALNNLKSDLINVGQTLKVNGKSSAPAKPVVVSKPVVNNNIKVDGYWEDATTKALQKHFKTVVDGKLSSPSLVIKAIQKAVGVKSDGYIGPNTIRAMQKHFGTPQDGIISKPSTMVKVMQTALNKGKF